MTANRSILAALDIGNGYVIEAANTSVGVIKTRLAGRGWTEWCKLPYIDYLE